MDHNFYPFLQKVTPFLAAYLESVLPILSKDWWNQKVVPVFMDDQRRQMELRKNTRLASFDLAALLRIFDWNWREISFRKNLTPEIRNYLKDMQNLRNRWSHPSSEGISVDDEYRDLDTIQRFATAIGADDNFLQEIRTAKNLVAKEMLPAVSNEGIEQKSFQISDDRPQIQAQQTTRISHNTFSDSQNILQIIKRLGCDDGYKSSRLCFKANIIEKLSMEGKFCIVTPDGTYRFTKREFYETFPNVVASKSYQESRLYHFPKPPKRALKFKVE